MTIVIKDFFYGTPMEPQDYEQAQLAIDLIPDEIIDQCQLRKIAVNNRICFEMRKGMPRLKQASLIANKHLTNLLACAGYVQSKFTPLLWKHKKNGISFTLVVDDLGVKFAGQKAVTHLLSTLRSLCAITIDWTGANYLGFTLDWDYVNHHVTISMPDFVKKALHQLMHKMPEKPVHSPACFTLPMHGKAVQWAEETPDLPLLLPEEFKKIKRAVGVFYYYARAMDVTMTVAINDLAVAQTKGNKKTMTALMCLLNYAATHPDAKIRYSRSGMILHMHSDESYLSLPKAKSRARGHYFLSDFSKDPAMAKLNSSIHVLYHVLKNVMRSAAKTEIASTFENAKEILLLRQVLKFLNHPQPPTPIQVDNTTAVSFVNKDLKQKQSKAIDMCLC